MRYKSYKKYLNYYRNFFQTPSGENNFPLLRAPFSAQASTSMLQGYKCFDLFQ